MRPVSPDVRLFNGKIVILEEEFWKKKEPSMNFCVSPLRLDVLLNYHWKPDTACYLCLEFRQHI